MEEEGEQQQQQEDEGDGGVREVGGRGGAEGKGYGRRSGKVS
jgi:hypothetical protein